MPGLQEKIQLPWHKHDFFLPDVFLEITRHRELKWLWFGLLSLIHNPAYYIFFGQVHMAGQL